MAEWNTAGKVRMTPKGIYNPSISYEVLDLVSNSEKSILYIAKQAVPAGTALTNTLYWVVVSDVTEAITNAESYLQYIADAYSNQQTYAVGDYCIYDGNLYRCVTAITTAESWTAAHWVQTTLIDEVIRVENKIAVKDTYITPEEFGAVGDATTDDTTALQNAIDYGRTNNVAVRGFKRYKTTSTTNISGTYNDIYLKGISYTGSGYAISITGGYHNIVIDLAYCGSGSGILLTRASNGYCAWNRIQMQRLFAHGHAVTFDTTNGMILYNTFDIRAIKSDTGDCYHGSDGVEENVYMNSSCTCTAGWAIYNCGGRFYDFTLEGDVLNGIYVHQGNYSFYGFRYRELVDKLVRRVNGNEPTAQGGTLIKFYHASSETCNFLFSGNDMIPYEGQ